MRVSALGGAREIGRREVDAGRRRGELGEMGDEPGALFAERRALVAPRRVDSVENLRERGPAPTRRRRPIGAAEERRAVGRKEHRHRPAALLAHRMQRRHVKRVDVRPLLAIDLHVDEQIVHQRRDRRVLEQLVRHDMAPVTGGVADRQQDRPVAALRFGERLGSPGPPMNRVAGVLQQIGRGRAGEPVSLLRHGGLRARWPVRMDAPSWRRKARRTAQSASARFSIALKPGAVERPADVGHSAARQRRAPGVTIVVVGGDIEAVDDRHAARELAGALDLDEMAAPASGRWRGRAPPPSPWGRRATGRSRRSARE